MTLPRQALSRLEDLPDDVVTNIVCYLSLADLTRLERVSRTVNRAVKALGFPRYLSTHPQHHITICQPQSEWNDRDLVRKNNSIIRNLQKRQFHALQIGPTWSQAVIPSLSITSERLVLAVGGHILILPLVDGSDRSRQPSYLPAGPARNGGAKAVGRARDYKVTKRTAGSEADIIGVADLGDGQLGVAQYDGTLQRMRVDPGQLVSTAHYPHPRNINLYTFTSSESSDVMMTTTSSGLVSLFKTRSPWVAPETFDLPETARAWSSLLTTSHRYLSPTALLGLSDGIHLHTITPSGPSGKTSRVLIGPDVPKRSSPYDMTFPANPSAHHPSLLLSAWFDSHLRLHDLRSPSPTPVTEFFDPWQWADGSAMYSCTYLSEQYIAGGGARHGTVSLFDVRYPKKGWSIFSPGGKGSPVYSLKGEGGRLWGVTEKRAFTLAFDDSGSEMEGLVLHEARAPKERAKEKPSGWRGRGGRWAWTVRQDEVGEGSSGYEHSQRGVTLFDSLPVV